VRVCVKYVREKDKKERQRETYRDKWTQRVQKKINPLHHPSSFALPLSVVRSRNYSTSVDMWNA
jgi:hypothetical protein